MREEFFSCSGWLVNREEDKFQRIQAHKGFTENCCFSNDGSLLATSSGDDTLKVWRVDDLSLWLTFTEHDGVVWDCDFNHDSSLLCSCSSDKTVRVWQLDTAKELIRRTHQATVWICRFCPGYDKTIASCSSEDTYDIVIWDYQQDCILRIIDGHRNIVEDITFSPYNGSTLACCSRDKNVYLWKNYLLTQGELLPVVLKGHKRRVNSCAFSPFSDDLLVSCSSDTTIIVWDTVKEVKKHVMYGHYNAIWKCAFGYFRGHLLLATCSSDRSLRYVGPDGGGLGDAVCVKFAHLIIYEFALYMTEVIQIILIIIC